MSIAEYAGPALALGGAGLAVGAGARLGKHLLQSLQGRETGSPVDFKPLKAPVSRVPVDVTPEEAEELRRKGMKVKVAMRKTAEGFLKDVGAGAAATGAAYGGWSLVSHLLNKQKAEAAKQRLGTARHRVEGLLDQNPVEADVPVANAIKTAEDKMVKQALFDDAAMAAVGAAGNGLGTVLSNSGVGYGLGGIGALMGIRAFRNAADKNKQQEVIKALKRVHETQPEQASQIEMEPIERRPRPEAVKMALARRAG